MKTAPCLLAAVLLLAGCGENSGQAPAKSGTNATRSSSPPNASADYLGTMIKAQQSAVKTVDSTSLDKAIQMFQVEKGRNPKDLDELVKEKYIPKIPPVPNGMKIVYDAAAGTVKVVPQ